MTTNQYKIRVRPLLQVIVIIPLCSYLLSITSCRKYLQIGNTSDKQLASQVFTNDGSANSAIAGIYRTLRDNLAGNTFNITIQAGLTSDELVSFLPGPPSEDYHNNAIQPNDYYLPWPSLYQCIYQANAVIEGLQVGNNLPTTSKNQYLGEAKFMRAFCYFYLLNLFGNVPLLTSTNVQVNSSASNASDSDIYNQIITDLKDAQQDLVNNYSYGGGEKVRANSWVATAFLARVYLCQKNWAEAEKQATAVIDSKNYSLLPSPDGVFNKNNSEAILQLSNTPSDIISDPSNFIFDIAPKIILSDELVNAFQLTDLRRQFWIQSGIYNGDTYYYPIKYSSLALNPPEYYTLFRLAEQYLIRAEARAEQGNIQDAESDLNTIRARANLPAITNLNQPNCIDSIFQERRLEFFAEIGQRWIDLKRTGRIDSVMAKAKPVEWKPFAALWPIPLTDIQSNSNLKQNPGYY